MSNKIHHETRAPSGPSDLSKMVADLIKLSSDCVSEYDISTCSRKIEELTMYLHNPTGPAQPISQVLGKLNLLYEQSQTATPSRCGGAHGGAAGE